MSFEDWKKGDVVAITDEAHPEAICVLTTKHRMNDGNGAWMLVDETCFKWVTTDWVEARQPQLIVHESAIVRLDAPVVSGVSGVL